MTDKMPPLDPDIANLLATERDRPAAGAAANAAQGRVAGRLAATLGIPLLIPGGAFPPPDAPTPDAPVDPSGVDPSGLDASGLDPSGLDPSALLDPSLLDPTAVAAVGKAAAGAIAGKAVAGGAAAAAGTTAGGGAAVAVTTAAATTAVGATGAAGASAAAGAGIMALITKPLLVGTFVVGTMVGGTTVAVVQPALTPEPKPKIVYIPRTPVPNVAEAALSGDILETADVQPAAEPKKRRRRARKVTPKVEAKVEPVAVEARRDGELAKETALVQMARTSLQRQKHAQALDALQNHKRTFPTGKLSEERDALLIFSLVGLGKANDAKGAARRFSVQYPKSIFRTSVKAALKTK